MANTLPTNNEPRLFRDFRHFSEEAFHQDLIAVDFKTLISNDVNESISAIVSNLHAITNYHAPLRQSIKTATETFREALDYEGNHAFNQTKT